MNNRKTKQSFLFLGTTCFYYTYVLSFYKKATGDKRFKEAFNLLKNKLKENQMIVENPNRKLANLDFCKKEQPSIIATNRFNEIVKNL